MVTMTPERWDSTSSYINVVLGDSDSDLDAMRARTKSEGLPDIAISSGVGHALTLLVRAARTRVALEVGTLGGYSAAWIARGLDRDGRLITIEREPAYAAFAARELAGLSLGPKIEVRQGDALAVLGGLEEELGAESLDFAFVDADKSQYLDYWRAIDPCLKPGAIFVADNALGTGSWWIDELDHPERRGVHALNQALADHPGYDTALFPLREGLLVALKR